MSYKKINDLQYLYEGITSKSAEIDEDIEYYANVIISEMIYQGYSESAIGEYIENITEDQVIERVTSFYVTEELILNENIGNFLKNMDPRKIKTLMKTLNTTRKGAIEYIKKKLPGRTKQLKLDLNKKPLTKKQELEKRMSDAFEKNKDKIPNAKDGSKIKKIAGATTAVTGAAVVGSQLTGSGDNKNDNTKKKVESNKDDKNTDIKNQVDKYVADRKGPINKDLTIDKSEAGKAKYAEKAAKREVGNQPTNPSGKELPKPRAVKPGSARANMIARNKEIFGKDSAGNDRVDKLRDKNAAFQASKKSGSNYSRKDFIKDFPKSNAAKDARKSKRIPSVMDMESYDAYDLVLSYLMETEQVASIEEANYIMTEMDEKTIQTIVEMDRMGGPAALGAIAGVAAFGAKKVIDGVKGVKDKLNKAREKKQKAIDSMN